jgi:hypothetical protein
MFDLKPTEQRRGTAGTLLFAFLLLLTATALGQQNPDFSGVYVMKSLTTSTSIVRAYPWKTLEGKTLLKVVQNGSALEVALTSDGKTITNTYVLGSESQNTESDGTPTSDRAEMKGKTLVIHSSLHIRSGALQGIPVQDIQKWSLSSDSKTLTIRGRYQIGMERMSLQDDSRTAIYTRQ